MDMDVAYLNLSVDEWLQTISHKSELSAPGASMRARCSALDDYQLTLSTEERITQLPIDVSFSVGPMTVGNGRPIERGIGLFNYIGNREMHPPGAIGCYLGFDLDHYNELWAQVRNGTFNSSSISLDLAPFPELGERLWTIRDNRGSLFVLGAAIHFKHSQRS
jgi:hypothetical protein